MVGDRAGEGVLGVGVDVHLHDAVAHCLGDVFSRGARAAVEDEVEGLLLADLSTDSVLDLPQQLRAQLDVAGLVHAVDVAESQRRQVAALLTSAQRPCGGEAVFDGGVELVVDLVLHPVLFAADDADLDLEQRVGVLRETQHLLGDLQVLLQRHGRTVPHVGAEQRLLTVLHPLGGDLQQRLDPVLKRVLGGVVGVQDDVDVVALGDLLGEDGEGDCSAHPVLDGRAGHVLGTAGRDLDDAVGLCFGEAADGGVDGLRGCAVHGGVGELLRLGTVDELGIDLGRCDGHGFLLRRAGMDAWSVVLLILSPRGPYCHMCIG